MDCGYIKTMNRCMKRAEPEHAPVFNSLWQPVYEAYSVSEFNALIEAHMLFLYKKYQFVTGGERGWVSPHAWYRFGSGPEAPGDYKRPLSYWAITEQVLRLPSEAEIEQELIWRKLLALKCNTARRRKEPLEDIHYEDVHGSYVRDICHQMMRFERLLQKWAQIGKPRFQDECFFNLKKDKEVLRHAMRAQNLNLLDAKRRFELFKKVDAPRFVLEIVRMQIQYEISVMTGLTRAAMLRT